MKKCVCIISGGMDSITMLHDLHKQDFDIYALSFNYGQKHCKELLYASENCKMLNILHKVINMREIGNELLSGSSLTSNIEMPEGNYDEENMKLTVVPNRNMIMLSLAIGYAISIEAGSVYYGAHSGDHAIYPDCRPAFLKALQKTALLCDWSKVKVKAPYLNLNKISILKRGLKIGVDYSKTWTCYNGREKACGKCGACQERLEAFRLNKITDPIQYDTI